MDGYGAGHRHFIEGAYLLKKSGKQKSNLCDIGHKNRLGIRVVDAQPLCF